MTETLDLELVKPAPKRRKPPARVMRVGIPTKFRGIQFRSRTEAKWAAFFDELGWRWSYEPRDCLFWIPDFALHFDAGKVLVEVKSTDEDFAVAESKIDCSGYVGPALIVGEDADRNLCGRITDTGAGFREWTAAELFYCTNCERPSVLSSEGSHRCRQCGETDHHVAPINVTEAWAKACDSTQWRPGR